MPVCWRQSMVSSVELNSGDFCPPIVTSGPFYMYSHRSVLEKYSVLPLYHRVGLLFTSHRYVVVPGSLQISVHPTAASQLTACGRSIDMYLMSLTVLSMYIMIVALPECGCESRCKPADDGYGFECLCPDAYTLDVDGRSCVPGRDSWSKHRCLGVRFGGIGCSQC